MRIGVASPAVREALLHGLAGPGGVFVVSGGDLVPTGTGAPPLLDRVVLVDAADPVAELDRGTVDLVLAWGDESRRLAALEGIDRLRAPGWDRAYGLWLDGSMRWVNDPRFRRWLSDALDREAMARVLFGGRAVPIERLSGLGDPPPPVEAVPRRPLSPSSRPRLRLRFDEADAAGRSLVLRIRAELAVAGVEIEPVPVPWPAAPDAAGQAHMTLLAHPPGADDPLQALRATLRPLASAGSGAGAALRVLERAAGSPDAARRRETARLAEDGLLIDSRLVPLVRVDSWLGHRRELAGVRVGGWGELELDRAGWIR